MGFRGVSKYSDARNAIVDDLHAGIVKEETHRLQQGLSRMFTLSLDICERAREDDGEVMHNWDWLCSEIMEAVISGSIAGGRQQAWKDAVEWCDNYF